MLTQVLGWVATILFCIMLCPQIYKTVTSKTTEGVSLITYIIFLIANIIALTYAILINQYPLIIKYGLSIIITIIYIIIYWRIK